MIRLLVAVSILISADSLAENYSALVPMPKEYLSAPGDAIEVGNMPEARSQGGLPVCYGISAWYAYMQLQCKAAHSDCRNLDADNIPSPVMIGALGVDKALYEKYGKTYNKVVPYSIGGGDLNALDNLSGEDEVWADSCFPLDRLIKKFGGNNRKMYSAFEALRTQYFDRNKADGRICIGCLQDVLRDDFALRVDQATIQRAFDENVFDKFLFDLFVRDCAKKVDIGDFHVAGWPNMGETRSYDNFVNRLTGLLKGNTPVLTDVCLDRKNVRAEQCQSGHALLIAGYRKVCSAAKCTDYLKVYSSWGVVWQQQNSDGWVDGRNLYEHIATDSSVGWLR